MTTPESHNPDQPSSFSNAAELRNLEQPADYVEISNDRLFQPIPVESLPEVAGWKEIPLTENGEQLVPLGSFSENDDIFTSSIYYGEHNASPYMDEQNRLDGSLVTMFVREEVVTKLRHAQQILPEGHFLIVLDSYRTLQVQQALYDHYYAGLQEVHPDWNNDELSAETQKYVSLPSSDGTKPSPHNTGGSVDLAILKLSDEDTAAVQSIEDQLDHIDDKDSAAAYRLQMQKIGILRTRSQFLNFGTQFDHGGHEAALNYFEVLERERPLTPEEAEARDNRRMLYNAMTEAGMEPYGDE